MSPVGSDTELTEQQKKQIQEEKEYQQAVIKLAEK